MAALTAATRGRWLVAGVRLRNQRSLHQRAEESRGRPLASDITQHESERPARQVDVVEEVAADGPARLRRRRGIKERTGAMGVRQERSLDGRRGLHLMFQRGEVADRLRQQRPTCFALEPRSAGGGHRVELRVATLVYWFPISRDQPVGLQPMERRIERCPRHPNHFCRQLVETLHDVEAMHRCGRDRLQHQHVEGRWRQGKAGGSHGGAILTAATPPSGIAACPPNGPACKPWRAMGTRVRADLPRSAPPAARAATAHAGARNQQHDGGAYETRVRSSRS